MKKYFLTPLFFFLGLLVFSRASPQQQENQRNYNNCLRGYSGCDLSTLTDDEKTQVQQAAHQRNYNNCLHGYSGCDPSKLTEAEKLPVQESAKQRNYNNCLHGYSGCDLSRLTADEGTQVQRAAHQRNYNNCLHDYSGCDLSQLTEAEKSVVSSSKSSTPTTEAQSAPNTIQNGKPRYNTNRDGERVQSPTYSKTIPAGATAQCRDGTYSFSRHHQGTCSHHGGVARWLGQ